MPEEADDQNCRHRQDFDPPKEAGISNHAGKEIPDIDADIVLSKLISRSGFAAAEPIFGPESCAGLRISSQSFVEAQREPVDHALHIGRTATPADWEPAPPSQPATPLQRLVKPSAFAFIQI